MTETGTTPETLTEVFDVAYKSTRANGGLHSYVGMLEGMLTVLLIDHPGSREWIIRDLKNFAAR